MRLHKPSGDTGEAASGVTAALAAYADGTGSEHAAVLALAAARLLVPVVAVPGPGGPGGNGGTGSPPTRGGIQGGRPPGLAEPPGASSEMALPTLIGNDGRTAIVAFTGTETLSRWQEDTRPVPVSARQVWAAAQAEADAAVIDVAGPVPLVIEGARLRALANGQPPPLPHEDPDIHAEVAAVTPDFTLEAGGHGTDLAVILKTPDMDQLRRHAEQIAVRLSVRLRRGIEIRAFLSRTYRAGSPAQAGSGAAPSPRAFTACGPAASNRRPSRIKPAGSREHSRHRSIT